MGAFSLSIREILKSSSFQNAAVIAGVDGLDRIVNWVHVMEVPEIGQLLDGNELILSTGVGWNGNQSEVSTAFLKQLIEAGVSGLCIELVKYTKQLPPGMIRLADENRFPIIAFYHEVRFIDITQSINMSIMLRQGERNISHNPLKLFYFDEQSNDRERKWAIDWLQGGHPHEEVQQYIKKISFNLKAHGGSVCICEMRESIDESKLIFYRTIFSSIFQKCGFILIPIVEKKELYMILLDIRGKEWKVRLQHAISQIYRTDFYKRISPEKPHFGIGKYTTSFHQLSESYLTAKESLQIQKKINSSHEIFYENLHIFRLISVLHKQGNLREYMMEYIGPIIYHDKKNNGELLHTLTIYLQCNGSKKVAAKNLYIVRQTLYHRLDKIKDLIGADFMEPLKRAAIEFSLYSYAYLNAEEKHDDTSIEIV